MSYEERLDLAIYSIQNKIRKSITDKYYHGFNGFFDWWISVEADLPQIYIYYFKEQFGNLITKDIEHQIYFAGDNLRYTIQAYRKCIQPSLDNILNYVEKFINYQMQEIDNWCEELSDALYVDEEKECEIKECHNFTYCQTKEKDWVIEQHGGTCSHCWMYFGQINNTNESKECTICNEIKNIIKLSCNHEMCFDCWKKIADDHTKLPTSCPYCRKQIGAWKLAIPPL